MSPLDFDPRFSRNPLFVAFTLSVLLEKNLFVVKGMGFDSYLWIQFKFHNKKRYIENM